MANHRIPRGTFDKNFLKGTVRNYPALERMTFHQKRELENRTEGLIDFESNARTAFQVVDYLAQRLVSKPEFAEVSFLTDPRENKKRKYFIRDPLGSGTMAIVKEAEKNNHAGSIANGINLILCHSDSPCLVLKPKPIQLEWDPEKIFNFPGVRFSPVGLGVSVHQWLGHPVKIIGYSEDRKGQRKYITLNGSVQDYSVHVDYRAEKEVKEAFPPEKSLEIVTDYRSLEDTLKKLEFQSIDDFSKSRFFAVPANDTVYLDESSKRLLMGYGHDDRACIHSAVDAIIKSRNLKRTSIVLITDREEIGDDSPSGAQGPFFDMVLDYIIEKEENEKDIEISEKDRRRLLYQSCMLVGDVSIAPHGHDWEEIDFFNAPKLGFGVYIAGDNSYSSNARFIANLMHIAERGKSRGFNLLYQMCGDFYSQDKADIWYRENSGKDNLYSRISQWTWAGIPCTSAHSASELICPADEFWTSRFYRRFLESDLRM